MSNAGIAVFEIPLSPTSQRLSVTLGNITYNMTLIWRQVNDLPDQQGWFLDIADSNNVPIINGIPLVTGADLLAQYTALNIGNGGQLFVQTDSYPDEVPTYTSLGVTSHLYWYPNP